MEFSATHNYDRSAKAVLAALTDFDCVRDRYAAIGHRDIELVRRDERADGGVTVVTRRVVPLQLPGFAKKVLSPTQHVTQTDSWEAPDDDGVRRGTFEVVGKGTPVSVRGVMRLAPNGDRRCTNVIDVTVECKIPLIGGKIAGFVAGDARKAVDHEQVWIREHLAGKRR